MKCVTIGAIGAVAMAMACVGCGSDGGDPAGPAASGGAGGGSAYPAGPYGTAVGSVAADGAFQGWADPAGAAYDAAKLTGVRLGDYYDPTGELGHELLVVNACSPWCVQCQVLYDTLPAKGAEYAAKGVVTIGAIAEQGPGVPETSDDLAAWGQSHGVGFPLVLDPENKLAAFAAVEYGGWIPAAVVISARDMRVLGVLNGEALLSGELWTFVDQKLAQIP